MSFIQAVAFGIGMLILAYLAFNNAKGVSDILKSGSKNTSSVITTLQGN